MASIDVLIVTALPEEFDAARDVGLFRGEQRAGVRKWTLRATTSLTPYLSGLYELSDGRALSVALTRPTRMGGTSTGPVAAALVERLRPRCIAMCGVCAGNPADTALGDVIFAENAYEYDEGKRTKSGMEFDHRQIPMDDDWVRTAQDMDPRDVSFFGEPSSSERSIWLLERLISGDDTARHPARSRYFTSETWAATIDSLTAAGYVTRPSVKLQLTSEGRAQIARLIVDDIDGPQRLPLSIVTAPMASGNVVVKDGVTWDLLRQHGVRTVAGLEMEAATIANVAHRLNVPNWVVAKGVMDHADARKDNRYKRFAARASADTLYRFLAARLASRPAENQQSGLGSRIKSFFIIGGATGQPTPTPIDRAKANDVFRTLGTSVAQAGAELVVCSPFPDSADFWAVKGFAESGLRGVVHFHSPRHEAVRAARADLDQYLGKHDIRFIDWFYPPPEDEASWSQAWLLCQLQALDRAGGVLAAGGRSEGTATTLLHLAETRRKLIVPLPLLGGASSKLYDRVDWASRYPGCDVSVLRDAAGARESVMLADQMVVAASKPAASHSWPPKSIFLSRSRRDSALAEQLAEHLHTMGIEVVLGDDQIGDYKMVEPAIEEAIIRCDAFLGLWSANYAVSQFCNDELEVAVERWRMGALAALILSVDGSDVVPRGARSIPSLVTKTVTAAISALTEILEGEQMVARPGRDAPTL